MFASCVVLLLSTSTSGQYITGDGYRADITFDDRNDRFDVTDIIGDQNQEFQDLPEKYEDDYRRRNDEVALVEVLKNNRENYNRIKQTKHKPRRSMNDFAYHDPMTSTNQDLDYTEQRYERGLANFRAQHTRRNLEVIDLNQYLRQHKPSSKLKLNITRRNLFDFLGLNRSKKAKKPKKVIANTTQVSRRMQGDDGIYERLLRNGYDVKNYAVPTGMKISGFIELPVLDNYRHES